MRKKTFDWMVAHHREGLRSSRSSCCPSSACWRCCLSPTVTSPWRTPISNPPSTPSEAPTDAPHASHPFLHVWHILFGNWNWPTTLQPEYTARNCAVPPLILQFETQGNRLVAITHMPWRKGSEIVSILAMNLRGNQGLWFHSMLAHGFHQTKLPNTPRGHLVQAFLWFIWWIVLFPLKSQIIFPLPGVGFLGGNAKKEGRKMQPQNNANFIKNFFIELCIIPERKPVEERLHFLFLLWISHFKRKGF